MTEREKYVECFTEVIMEGIWEEAASEKITVSSCLEHIGAAERSVGL